MSKFIACVLLAFMLNSVVDARETVSIAAAADLIYCVAELNSEFRKRNADVDVEASNGSSGMFFQQIRQGAPFDIFMSADLDYPRKLAAEGHIDAASLTLYAIGRIVLWTT